MGLRREPAGVRLPSPVPAQRLVQEGGQARVPQSGALAELPGGFAQLELLCRRGFRLVWRDPSLMFLQLVVTLLVGGATGGLFFHIGERRPPSARWARPSTGRGGLIPRGAAGVIVRAGTDLNGAHNRMGVLFFVVLYFSVISMSSIGTIVSDKEIFLRERAAGLYTVEPYFASKIICDLLPLRVLPPVLFSLMIYPMCTLHTGRM